MKNRIIITVLLIMTLLTSLNASASPDGANIALGRGYSVEFGAPTEYSYRNYTENGEKFDIDTGCLTDGKYAPADYKSAGYYRAFRSYSRFICFDFGAEMRIDGYGGSFLHNNSGIYAPAYLKLWLSADGENYVCVNRYDTESYSKDRVKRKYEIATDVAYRARYAKVEFECGVFVWCDEIAVYGSDDAENASALPAAEVTRDKGIFPQGKLNGISSIIKIYDGYYSDQSKADNTEEELLPYISYIENGEIKDVMFDTVAFVPCHTDYPSGGRLTKSGNKPGAVMSDWELYISRTFHAEYNLASLDKAAAKRNAALGINEKVKVLLTMPYPMMQSKPFGDIDGDGKDEYTRTAAERIAVAEWYAKKVCSLFDERGFRNIELAGFYWYAETVGLFESPDEYEFTAGAIDAIHKIRPGCAVIFDPFYLSVGFDRWEEYGFDGAVMQPNLVFRLDYTSTPTLGEFAQTIKKYGLGVEIETAEPGNFRTAENIKKYGEVYENYLYYGAKTGYMNALQTFYQGAGPGTVYSFYASEDPYMQYLYKLTYLYIKKAADLSVPEVVSKTGTVEAGKKRVPLDLEYSTYIYTPDLLIEASAQHGKCQVLPNNRRVFYTPDAGFTGTDVISLKIATKFGDAAERKLNVEVVPNGAGGTSADESDSAPEESGETDAETSAEETPAGSKLPLIAGVAAAAVAIIAIAVVLRKKKK